MKNFEVIELTKELIQIPSPSRKERKVLEWLENYFSSAAIPFERQMIEPDRWNLLVGENPAILFTTHVDVVSGKEEQFNPVIKEGRLFGRGACDAKGLIACMIVAARELWSVGAKELGLLFVVGEEEDGIGAKEASRTLQGRGVRALINGEPTEGKLASAHKGAVGFEIKITGRSVHSGYPQYGIDANQRLIKIAQRIMSTDFGRNLKYGESTCNLGVIRGGMASNVISSSASLSGLIRTVELGAPVVEKLQNIVHEFGSEVELTFPYLVEPTELIVLPGIEAEVVSYCSDVSFFANLKVPIVMYGPGSILEAHTDQESIACDELRCGVEGYKQVFRELGKIC